MRTYPTGPSTSARFRLMFSLAQAGGSPSFRARAVAVALRGIGVVGALHAGASDACAQTAAPSRAVAPAKPAASTTSELERLVSRQEIDKKWDEGIQLAKRNDFVGASEAFRLAYSWSKEPRMLLNLALAEMKAGRNGAALRHFREYIGDPHASPEKVTGVTQDILPKLTAITGRVVVDSPGSTEIIFDKDFTAHSGDEVDVDPGDHELVAMGGHGAGALAHATVHVGAGDTVRISLTAPAAAPTPDPVPVVVSPAAESRAPEPDRIATTSGARVWAVVALGVGTVAAAGIGTYFTVSANDAKTQVDALRDRFGSRPNACLGSSSPDCVALESNVQSWFDARTAAYWSFGIAGGLAATTVATWLLWPKASRPAAGAWLAPSLTPGRAGVVAGGSF